MKVVQSLLNCLPPRAERAPWTAVRLSAGRLKKRDAASARPTASQSRSIRPLRDPEASRDAPLQRLDRELLCSLTPSCVNTWMC